MHTSSSGQRQRQQPPHQADERADKKASSAAAHSTAAASFLVLPSTPCPHLSTSPLLPPLPHAVASYPTISYHALQRAEKTIADFVQSYLFIFHAADDDVKDQPTAAAAAAQGGGEVAPPISSQQLLSLGLPSPSTLQRLFTWLPLLTFVSATIYQLDEENEEQNQRERERRERRTQNSQGGAQTQEDQTSVGSSTASSQKPQKRTRSTGENNAAFSLRLKRQREEGHEARSSDSASSTSISTSSSDDDSASQIPVRSSRTAASSFLQLPPPRPCGEDSRDLPKGEEEEEDSDAADESRSYSVLLTVLRSKGLLTPRVEEELLKGRIYWQLERKICRQLVELEEYRSQEDYVSSSSSSSSPRAAAPSPLSPSDVNLASRCKSFDYRVLHLICFGLRGAPVDDAIMKALSFNERLVDLHDDLVDYEDDVLSNSFNLYRCYVSLYGAAQAPTQLLQLIQQLERQFDSAMEALPPAQRTAFRARELRAMQEHGRSSSSSSSSFLPQDGSVWSVPPPIANERVWRAEVQQAEQSSMQLQANSTPLS